MSGSKSSAPSFAQAASQTPAAGDADPMGMTVYPMPQATEALASIERARSGRWKMIGILLACAAPVIASYLTYYVIRPEGRRNFGELIDPQRTLPETSVRTLAGESVPLASLKGQWLLVSVASGACDAA